MKELNRWYQTLWLPMAAFIYLSICLFDFVIAPVYIAVHNSRIENAVILNLQESNKDTSAIADSIIKSNQASRQWNPLTLMGGGMFHLAFGSLLAGGAVTRGFAKKAEVEGYYKSITGTPDPDPPTK